MEEDVVSFYRQKPRMTPRDEYEAKVKELESHGFLFSVFEWVERLSSEHGVVLELGAGTGATLALLSERILTAGLAARLVAVDFFKPEPPDRFPGVEYIESDLMKADEKVPDGAASILLMIEVIEHLWDPDKALRLAKKLLAPNGYLVLSTPNLSSALNRLALLIGYQPIDTEVSIERPYGRPGGGLPVGHIRAFAFRSLLQMLSYHGFEIVHARTYPRNFSTYGRSGGALTVFDSLSAMLGRGLASRTLVISKNSLLNDETDANKSGNLHR